MISVVMPVYNAEKYVAEAVESILQQTYTDFEFIIIDDCSTDNSYGILQTYAAKDIRIRLFKNDVNNKLPKTLNFGIAQSNGKYIARMDADDISLPERFAKQVEFMESHPEIGVCGTWIKEFIDENKQITRMVEYPVEHKLISITLLFDENCLAHPSTLLKREIFTDIQLYYESSFGGAAEDYELWVRLLVHGILFHNLPEPLLMYRKSETQTMVVSKDHIDTSVQSVIEANFKRYFLKHMDGCVLDTYLKLRYKPKKELKIFEHIYYQYLLFKIKRVNSKLSLFDKQIFSMILSKESIFALWSRYLGNKNVAKFK